ncbi:MAG: DUF4397 domain-containing protein [Gemmatimonas sp.]
MRTTRMTAAMSTAALILAGAVACSGDKKEDAAVQTTTAGGKDVSPSAGAADAKKVSMVRMINALPTMSDVMVTADDNALFSGVNYKAVTDYVELRDNVTRFRLKNAKSDTTIASNNEMMMDGSRYTVVALPEKDGGVRLRVLHDEIVPDVGKTRLRVVHAMRGVSEIDVMTEGNNDAIFDNVNFGSEAGYKEMDPMQGTLIVKVDGANRQLLKKQMNFVAGHSYTIVLAGNGAQRVDAIIVDDQALGTTGK